MFLGIPAYVWHGMLMYLALRALVVSYDATQDTRIRKLLWKLIYGVLFELAMFAFVAMLVFWR